MSYYQLPTEGITSITREKAKNDILSFLKQLDVDVIEVGKCTANVEIRKGYTVYIYPQDLANVQNQLKSFIENECKPRGISKLFVWPVIEGNYRYIFIGFFENKINVEGLLYLYEFIVGIP
ncbi:MAG: hypothetical protein QXY40_09665 [Candidatus Methanomethylicia archaeon]